MRGTGFKGVVVLKGLVGESQLTVERHGGVDRDQLISLQQEDSAIQGLPVGCSNGGVERPGDEVHVRCMREVCLLLGIKQKMTTPYHRMCNGLVKNFYPPRSLVCVVSNFLSGIDTSILSTLPTEKSRGSHTDLARSSCVTGQPYHA
ncbi:hypothetical protein PoB_006660700 [Plakobranchus ocellatus]|uniref:Uncharacterized protein n=1 Tax=Plakobranchus ocellatus TaxID=259542 RepID=A0AAV4D7P6_9GAST|nr:hypothetical protein PoB_006660700 [Plakobranchus ocellatus]